MVCRWQASRRFFGKTLGLFFIFWLWHALCEVFLGRYLVVELIEMWLCILEAWHLGLVASSDLSQHGSFFLELVLQYLGVKYEDECVKIIANGGVGDLWVLVFVAEVLHELLLSEVLALAKDQLLGQLT